MGGRAGVGAAGARREAGRGALGDEGHGRRGAPLPVVERGAAERRACGSGDQLPRVLGKEAEQEGEAFFAGRGPADRPMERDGSDARRAGAPVGLPCGQDRERDVQHARRTRATSSRTERGMVAKPQQYHTVAINTAVPFVWPLVCRGSCTEPFGKGVRAPTLCLVIRSPVSERRTQLDLRPRRRPAWRTGRGGGG